MSLGISPSWRFSGDGHDDLGNRLGLAATIATTKTPYGNDLEGVISRLCLYLKEVECSLYKLGLLGLMDNKLEIECGYKRCL